MKFSATIQNPVSFTSPLSFDGGYGGRIVRRRPFRIKPFVMEEVLPTLAESDSLAQRQEIFCAAVLGLSLIASVIIGFIHLIPA